ncbi:SDR family oxidoreductase [Nocardiopsis baichengensis]|uniref:SDR family oxidoreductase n=1 Tax=Nocardiopsis baichengensis TaxID=280240 RepID=UPI00034B9CFB|nr:SDR family oxidoreductase [Nocardiopsis baichengensis]
MICAGRTALVTGAGRGLGRAHALEFARQGARVVVNDLGVGRDGTGAADGPAQETVDAVRARGGEAVACTGDIASADGAREAVRTALETYGRLDTLVNNAGFVRDRMLVNLSEDDWDAVVRVHLRGHFLMLREAAGHWRSEAKAGRRPAARVVNTSSGAGLLGSVGQANYAAAKAGITALTLVAAAELERYGVTVNAVAPAARTRMTEEVFADRMARPQDGFDAMDPANVAPLVVWLGSGAAQGVSGRVFEAEGGRIRLMEGYRPGPEAVRPTRWYPPDVGGAVEELLAQAPPPQPVYGA